MAVVKDSADVLSNEVQQRMTRAEATQRVGGIAVAVDSVNAITTQKHNIVVHAAADGGTKSGEGQGAPHRTVGKQHVKGDWRWTLETSSGSREYNHTHLMLLRLATIALAGHPQTMHSEDNFLTLK